MTIAIATGLRAPAVSADTAVAAGGSGEKRKRRRLRRVLIAVGGTLFALIALAAAWIGIGIYKIDHAVHHVAVPASCWPRARTTCSR